MVGELAAGGEHELTFTDMKVPKNISRTESRTLSADNTRRL